MDILVRGSISFLSLGLGNDSTPSSLSQWLVGSHWWAHREMQYAQHLFQLMPLPGSVHSGKWSQVYSILRLNFELLQQPLDTLVSNSYLHVLNICHSSLLFPLLLWQHWWQELLLITCWIPAVLCCSGEPVLPHQDSPAGYTSELVHRQFAGWLDDEEDGFKLMSVRRWGKEKRILCSCFFIKSLHSLLESVMKIKWMPLNKSQENCKR